MSDTKKTTEDKLTESIWQNLALAQENRKLSEINAKCNRSLFESREELAELKKAASSGRRDRT